MAQYHSRRGPNVSQYIANLNTIPSAADMNQQQEDFANFDGDLDLFTNADFFDFDLNESAPGMPNGMQFNGQQHPSPTHDPTDKAGFVNQPQYFQNPFNQFPANPALPGRTSLPPSPPNGVPFAGQIQQSQPTVPSPGHFSAALTPTSHTGPQTGEKRKAGMISTIPNPAAAMEADARDAAEEDKRRRNTAASARFRVKKKQREQALEKTAKEMSEKVQVLEARIGQLEMENQWLKGLITEKNVKLEGKPGEMTKVVGEGEKEVGKVEAKKEGEKNDQDAESKEEMREQGESILGEKKRGVGTD
ncbi:Regulatory protein cys-3 [Elsinoe australis]|uniref:Regulatory protein cys-3 n=1 Tax=Elsinoe australis TaxID=40998 RepID=A0A2P7YEN3_9PEZI|nr:Regulatory protein cys-3 [Elsinoe australis]